MEAAQAERTPEFLEGLRDEGFVERFRASRMGSTTHISVLDERGNARAASRAPTARAAAIVVPGTGHPPQQHAGRAGPQPARLPPPSARAPAAEHDGADGRAARRRAPSWCSAAAARTASARRSCRRSSTSSTAGCAVDEAVRAPRLHFEDGVVYAEPGIDLDEVERTGHTVARFRALNLFFGGVQAVAAARRRAGRRRPAPRRRRRWQSEGREARPSPARGGPRRLRRLRQPPCRRPVRSATARDRSRAPG